MRVTIVGMIYKSTSFLDFMMEGIRSYCLVSKEHDVDYVIIANDPNDSVKQKLIDESIQHLSYSDPKPNDYYLNRVYRAWNHGGNMAAGDVVVFVNSDMAFTKGWLENLLYYLDKDTIPCCRLIERGKMPSGKHGVNSDFGGVSDFSRSDFDKYARMVSKDVVKDGGLFMPCAFYKKDFVESGGYPEGNVYAGGPGDINTPLIMTGDTYFFYSNPVMSKKRHVTVFNSIIYHVQEGEMDE